MGGSFSKFRSDLKHLLVYCESGLVTTVARRRTKQGTLAAILKYMGLSTEDVTNLL